VAYRIEFSKRAEKEFESLPLQIQIRLQHRIDALALDPRPSGVKQLKDAENQYRLRVGSYRIVYEIQDAILLVILLRVGHRREVYRKR